MGFFMGKMTLKEVSVGEKAPSLSRLVSMNSRICHLYILVHGKEIQSGPFQGPAGSLSWHDPCLITRVDFSRVPYALFRV